GRARLCGPGRCGVGGGRGGGHNGRLWRRLLAKQHKPKVILAGFSAYSRTLDFKLFKEIADEVGAYTMADIAHIAGLIAGRQLDSPVPYFDIVTTSTHKTLRGPRGGLILCSEEFKSKVDKSVFPGLQGGPHEHTIAAKAVAFAEAQKPEFEVYAKQVILNAQAFAKALLALGYDIVTGGTDNHLMLVDLRGHKITGNIAEKAIEKIDISVNKNLIPFDPETPMVTSGIRIGTPTVTTRGMKEEDMKTIAGFIDQAVKNHDREDELKKVKADVNTFTSAFPLFQG
ncbi:MAG: serine hydroxymethyltransferase, partial [Candidatus Roizmanbacteria bacterium]